MTGYVGMDLPRFIAIARARRWLIAGIVVSAFILALGWSLLQASRYTAKADLLFGQTTSADAVITGGPTATPDVPDRTAATNLALASLGSVAANVERRFRGSATIDELKNSVTVAAQGTSDVVTVTAEWGSPTQAAAIANAFAAEIVDLRRATERASIQRAIDALTARVPSAPKTPAQTALADELNTKIANLEALKESADGDVNVVEHATPPDHRSSPKPLRNAVIASLVALILAIFALVLRARFDDRINDEDELAVLMGASVLARIPEVGRSRRAKHIWSLDQDPAFLESFEFLRLNLQLTVGDGEGKVIAVTSPAAADGKSTVVAWLARALALSGSDVMAVDLDLRKPELHVYLDMKREPGADVLEALLSSASDEMASYERPLLPEGHDDDDGGGEPGATNGEPPAPRRRAYTEDDVTAGLVELARVSGNAVRASRSLRSAGLDIPESTLRRWKATHAELYGEIRSASMPGSSVAPHLRVLTGSRHRFASGLIAKERLRVLFDQLREYADFVVVDTVPVSTVADASAVAAATDGVILVVDLERARRRELVSAKRQLSNAHAQILGIVINRPGTDFPVYYAREEERVPEVG